MLSEAIAVGTLSILFAAAPAPSPSPPTASVSAATQAPAAPAAMPVSFNLSSAPAAAPRPAKLETPDERAARLVGEYLAPLASAEPSAAAASELRSLVAQMGDEDCRKRDAASAAVVRRGMAAIPVLREAVCHRDPEIAFRVREALADIPAAGLRKILRGFEWRSDEPRPSRQQKIVAELAAIPTAAAPAVAKAQNADREVAEAARRYVAEAEGSGDSAGAETYRLSGRIMEARLVALETLLVELNREIAELRAREEAEKAQAAQAAQAAAVAAANPGR